LIQVGKQIVTNRLDGFLPSRIVFFLNNLHIIPRPIYLTRHGQSLYNVDERLGGDPPLTAKVLQATNAPIRHCWNTNCVYDCFAKGHLFTEKLREFMMIQPFDAANELCVWSSTMLRSVQTAEGIPCAQHVRWKAMEEIEVQLHIFNTHHNNNTEQWCNMTAFVGGYLRWYDVQGIRRDVT
jgi:6-phosphofructo-2-kinase / fructose-2,6-biphosphatase 2